MNKYNYLLVYTLPLSVIIAFQMNGIWTFMPIMIFFGLVPLLDLIIPPVKENMEKDEKQKHLKDSFYAVIIYSVLPVQVGLLSYFFYRITYFDHSLIELLGMSISMGLSCGVLGINVGHELGHRASRWEQLIGEILLLTSLDTHFLPYHNGGHHKNVATPDDSATARKNEWLILFWFRSHFGSYKEAWQLENARMKHENKSWFSLRNRMVVYTICNVMLMGGIYFFLGNIALVCFLIAAIFGIALLETVNYIEHYGLERKIKSGDRYERVKHHHSWNSDHFFGRSLLFNLSRHSDHHYNGSKHYQVLDSLDKSPQMPTGYPGMMLLSFFAQPLWFRIMNKRIEKLQLNLNP